MIKKMVSNKCPNCNIELSINFKGEGKIGNCLKCGFERAIIPVSNLSQTTLL